MKNITQYLFPLGLLCCQAYGASPILINGNFDAFAIGTGNYNSPYNGTTNPDGYEADFGPVRTYFESATGIGWQTDATAPQNVIEIWKSGAFGFNSSTGAGQFGELNAYQNAALFQDVTFATSGPVLYSFSHMNRNLGSDVLKLLVTYLGPDNSIGGTDNLVVVNTDYTATTLTTPSTWTNNEVNNAFISQLGGTYRISFRAISSAPAEVGGPANTALGNFLDNVKFEVVPEPSAALLGSLGALALLRRRRR